MSHTPKTSLILVGPSTTGKSAIAISIATKSDGEIINADKFYLYRDFDRTTGLYSPNQSGGIGRHLFGKLGPMDDCLTSEEYLREAQSCEEMIRARGKHAIFEGCYHRFVRKLVEAKPNRYTVIGITWTSAAILEEAVIRRVTTIFEDPEALREVDAGLSNGYRNSYVMSKGALLRPLVEYRLGHISKLEAQEKAIADVQYAAHKAYRRLLDLPYVKWYRHDGRNTEDVVNDIIMHWRDYAPPRNAAPSAKPAKTGPDALVYFSGVDSCGDPVRVNPAIFLKSFASHGANTDRLCAYIASMDYTGNSVLDRSDYQNACDVIADAEARATIDRLVHHNTRTNRVVTRGRDYHLHLIHPESRPEMERLVMTRQTILSNVKALANLTLCLTRHPSELTATEQTVAAVLLDHQKHYAMSMLFGAYYAILAHERQSRYLDALKSDDHCPKPYKPPKPEGPPVSERLLGQYEAFCEAAIRNYYSFIIGNAPPVLARPGAEVLATFPLLDLPKKIDKGSGDGVSKLTFRDFDHPGHLFYYAGNTLLVDRPDRPIDCIINPLFGAIEVGYAMRAIYETLGINKVKDVKLMRFSRHNEHESLNIDKTVLTQFIPRALEQSFIADLVGARKRIMLIDDGVGTGLTLVVLREYFRNSFNNPVGISAVEEDMSRTKADYAKIFFDYVYHRKVYDSSSRNETFVCFEDMAIPAIAHRSIKPIPGIIKAAIDVS